MPSSDDSKRKRRGLGKGLSALLPQTDSDSVSRNFAFVPISSIRPAPEQPRKFFHQDALNELAASIAESGLIQPLVVRKVHDDYELIAGERRWRACQLANIDEVPVVIKELTDEVAFTLALVENVQREDLSVLEQAHAFQRLIDDFGYTQQQIAQAVGISRSTVANSVRLLRLPSYIHELIENNLLSPGHARPLLSLPDEDAIEFADIIVKHAYSVRETEELVRDFHQTTDTNDFGDTNSSSNETSSINQTNGTGQINQPKSDQPNTSYPERTPASSPSFSNTLSDDRNQNTQPQRSSPQQKNVATAHLRDAENKLCQILGAKVSIQDSKGQGKLILHYESIEMLNRLLMTMGVESISSN